MDRELSYTELEDYVADFNVNWATSASDIWSYWDKGNVDSGSVTAGDAMQIIDEATETLS